MANEIQIQYDVAALTIDAFIRNSVSQIWSTGVNNWITYSTAQRTACAIPMTEQGTASMHYVASVPVPSGGILIVDAHQRLGASPAETDPPIGNGVFDWDGTSVLSRYRLPVNVIQVTGVAVTTVTQINANVTQWSGVPVPYEGANLSSGTIPYFPDVRLVKDTTNSKDEYTVTWYKNAVPCTSGQITSPTIQVIKRADGTDLVASTSMSFISVNIGSLKYDETSNRTTAGEDYIAKVQAIIDGAVRSWTKLVGRDS